MLDERQCRQAVARLFYNNNKDQRDFYLILELINEYFELKEEVKRMNRIERKEVKEDVG